MFIETFITELQKKIETIKTQLKEFEDNVNDIKKVNDTIAVKTLKEVKELEGVDLTLLDDNDFSNILDTFNFDNKDIVMNKFKETKKKILDYQNRISDGEVDVLEEERALVKWLDSQAKYIREYFDDFNDNNKEYYNSLKISATLYDKYLSYFKNGKLIKPIYDVDELNEVIKKSGLITSDKWKLLKYIGEMNMDLEKNKENDKEKNLKYTDDEILSFVKSILNRESKLIKSINDKILNDALNVLDYDEEKLKSMNLNSKSLVKYQKIPIIDAMNKIYKETLDMLREDRDEDAKKIEDNLNDLLQLVDSYDIIKKIES